MVSPHLFEARVLTSEVHDEARGIMELDNLGSAVQLDQATSQIET